MTNKKRNPESTTSSPSSERRGFLGALGGMVGGTLLAGCTDGVDTSPPGTVATPAVGTTPVKWVDTVDTDLRSSPGCVESEVVVARGFAAANDGGGGVFSWTSGTTLDDDGGTVIEATTACGIAAGRWVRIYSGPLDVRWFGAKQGSDTFAAGNDAAITLAIAAASSANNLGVSGGRVYFAPGAWYISEPITISLEDGIILMGAGGAGAGPDSVQTRLVWDGGEAGPMIKLNGTFRCSVQGLCLDGGGDCTGGIVLRAEDGAAKYNVVSDVMVVNMSAAAIGFDVGYTAGAMGENADLAFNKFDRFWIDGCDIGVRQRGNQTVSAVFEDGTLVGSLEYGMQFVNGDITVSRCFFTTHSDATADVFVAKTAQYARFIANTHETQCLTGYLFETATDEGGLRSVATIFLGVRVAYKRSSGSPRRIIDFQQNGQVTLVGCTWDGENHAPACYFAPPNVADNGQINDIGSRYVNGASASVSGTKASYTSLYSNGLASVPPYTASPLADHVMSSTRLKLYDSHFQMQDNLDSTVRGFVLSTYAGRLTFNTTDARPSNDWILKVQNNGTPCMSLNAVGGPAFYGQTSLAPNTRPAITGSRGGNAALASLLTALAGFGLITDSTTS